MKYDASRSASRSGAATTTKAVSGFFSRAYVLSARSRNPPNIVSRAATKVCTSWSTCPPRIFDITDVAIVTPELNTFR